jgi:uncharacterized protein YciI
MTRSPIGQPGGTTAYRAAVQYVVIAHDHDDDAARERRIAVRPEHMARCAADVERGVLLFAAALLDDDERMTGSVMLVDLPSRADVERWLAGEPYQTNGIWRQVDITRGRAGPWFTLGAAATTTTSASDT